MIPLSVVRDLALAPLVLVKGLAEIGSGLAALTAADGPLSQLTQLRELEHLPEIRRYAAVLPGLPPRIEVIEAQMTEMVELMRVIGPALDELSASVKGLQDSLGELEATVAAVSRLVPGAGRRRRARETQAA